MFYFLFFFLFFETRLVSFHFAIGVLKFGDDVISFTLPCAAQGEVSILIIRSDNHRPVHLENGRGLVAMDHTSISAGNGRALRLILSTPHWHHTKKCQESDYRL